MDALSTYARGVMGKVERPEVDKVTGLSPVIAIEQKTTSNNPRSTVGTTTEIYDFLRLLFAKTADAYSHQSGEKMSKQTPLQIQKHLEKAFQGQKIKLLAPIVKGRKGHYRELLHKMYDWGYVTVRIDGDLQDLWPGLQVDRYKTHDIEVLIDAFTIKKADPERLQRSLAAALKQGKGSVMVQDRQGEIHYFSQALMDTQTGLSYSEPAPNTFSFNSPYGACPTCEGLGEVTDIRIEDLIPDSKLSIAQGGIVPLGKKKSTLIFKQLDALLHAYDHTLDTPINKLNSRALEDILHGTDMQIELPSSTHSKRTWWSSFEGIIPVLKQQAVRGGSKKKIAYALSEYTTTCPACKGARLRQEALHFRLAGLNIGALVNMDLQQLYNWIQELPKQLSSKQQRIAESLLHEIEKRIRFLLEVGLAYLHLNRPMKSLSGGEAQRIRLATQIGTQLVGVLYILDEPSIGLHQRDNQRLINSLKQLRDLGNSVLVVEHDKDMMMQSDYLLDMGPGAGRNGGKVIAAGSPQEFLQPDGPLQGATAQYLRGQAYLSSPSKRRSGNGNQLTLTGCRGHNLKQATLSIPLGTLTCVTGVSGSGKSSLVHETLLPVLQSHIYKSQVVPLPYEAAEGLLHIDKVIEVSQSPIGRTPRSNPATYTGVFTDIRTLFSQLPEAKVRGYGPGRFSFNVKGGRCENCEGGGMKLITMDFLPTVHLPCQECKGKRYNRETLEVQYKGHSISDVLDMTVEQAVKFFSSYPRIAKKVETLLAVGLGYINLGQHATTLSGGEAQRVKLATELSKRDTGHTLYILDEPTTGLHFADIQLLLDVIHRLRDAGNTIVIIEHNLDVIKTADWIIDMGPEGGDGGGMVIAEGTPEQVAANKKSYTGKYLKDMLK